MGETCYSDSTAALILAMGGSGAASELLGTGIKTKGVEGDDESIELTGDRVSLTVFVFTFMDAVYPGWRYDSDSGEMVANVTAKIESGNPFVLYVGDRRSRQACIDAILRLRQFKKENQESLN